MNTNPKHGLLTLFDVFSFRPKLYDRRIQILNEFVSSLWIPQSDWPSLDASASTAQWSTERRNTSSVLYHQTISNSN